MKQHFLDTWSASLHAILLLLPDAVWVLVVSLVLAKFLGGLYPLRYRVAACLALASFGSMIGIFMGAAKEPLAQGLLPTFVTLTIGYLGHLFQKASRRAFFRLYLPAVIAMILAILFSTFYHRYFILPPTV